MSAGISGLNFSPFLTPYQNRASDPPKFKGNKELMPASMRVKDAAEALLTCIIDQVVSEFIS